MLKSSPPPSSTETQRPKARASRLVIDSPQALDTPSVRRADRPSLPATGRRSFSTQFAAAIRWLHIYVSLVGFTALTFFAVTGITLNHPTWFGAGAERVITKQGDMQRDWLRAANPSTVASDGADAESDASVSKLEIVEHLRSAHRVRGAVSEFRIDDAECMVIFKGPGYAADAYINRDTGSYTLTETMLGAVAIMNDLHKGRDSGPAWSVVIDVSALLTVFVSITGIVLLLYLKRKRWSGMVTAVAGTVVLALVYWLLVP